MTLKGFLGSVMAGAAYRNAVPLLHPPKLTEKTKTENSETIVERRQYSVVGGAVRGGLTYLFIKGAAWGLEEDVYSTARRFGDDFANFVGRLKGGNGER